MTVLQKILIVDDRKENLVALRQVLKGVDAEVIEAQSGNAALSATLDHHFALAILDVMMPGMSGFELAGYLREDEATRHMPVIFVTAALPDEHDIFSGYEAGAVDYIFKPYIPEVLLAKVRIFLEIDRQRHELQWQRDHLESLVIERTRALELELAERKQAEAERERLRDQLNQAQKMEYIGRLAGGVAHDFNNMLGVILGHAELALDQVNPMSTVHSDLAAIRKAAERSADLTRQLLAFARKQTVSPRILNLNDTVDGMLNMMCRLIGEDIRLIWNPCASHLNVRMDPGQIDQILANLCLNARDALGREGSITIETRTEHFSDKACEGINGMTPGEYAVLTVRDTGKGMSKEVMEHLFEPYFTTKDVGKGTGLGLATVYGMVRQNNGFIDVKSEPGQGTTFRIFLPSLGADAHPQMFYDELQEIPGHETILLVEDEPAILDMTVTMLHHLGYDVLASLEPAEALRMAENHSGLIDLLITDVIMPGMNGHELATSLQSRFPSLKRLFMSGYTADIIARHGVLETGVHFIQKPFSKTDLALKIRETLES